MGRGKPVIVLGDKTDHGGTVIEGDTTSTVAGKPIARVGDKVSCPKCKGTFPIIEGVADTFYSSKPVAIHGHKTACGATLIGSQTLLTVSTDPSGATSAPEPAAPPPVAPLAPRHDAINAAPSTDAGSEEAAYDRQFQLHDEQTGELLVNRLYRIHTPQGVIEGRSGPDGLTQKVAGRETDSIRIEVFAEGL
jgi:uncharacterized Zn-binding protein involved in type VI secretion